MASAEDLRQFATAQFLQQGIDMVPAEEDPDLWEMYRLVPEDSGLIESAVRSVGALVEREGWNTLGAHLDYLNDPKPIAEDDRAIIRKVLDSSAIAAWPRWFRTFAAFLLNRDSAKLLWSDLPE